MKRTNQKRKMGKRLAMLLSAVMLVGTLSVAASASTYQGVTALLCPQVNIVMDSVSQTFYDAQGREVHPIAYNGTTYLPLRAIGEIMGKNVNWDQSTLTVTVAGARTTPPTVGTPDYTATQQNISAQIRPDFTIIVDNDRRTFTDVNGTVVYPLLYNGSTYLPLRAIGGMMGSSVDWNSATSTVTMTSNASNGGLVTDADSFNQGSNITTPPTTTTPPQTSQPGQGTTGAVIGLETAKAKALAHSGFAGTQVYFVKARLTYEKGRQVYDIEFYTADRKEFDYEIDAYTGAVISFDYEAHYYNYAPSGSLIGDARARSIALAKVAGATAANITRVKLERDDGRYEYDVTIVYNSVKHEFEIDAYSGVICSWDFEPLYW